MKPSGLKNKANANRIETEPKPKKTKEKENKEKENKVKEIKEKENKVKERKNSTSEGVEVLDVWETQFKQFYDLYPKKVKRQDVRKWFQKNKPSSELFSSMINSLEQFRGSKEWIKDNGQYIPYPSTWLNQKRWEDEDINQRQPMSALQRAWNKEVVDD